MPSVQVENEYEPIREAIFAGLSAYNRSRIGEPVWKPIAISVRDDDGGIAGGACGQVWGEYLYVIGLWVDERLRGRDLATEAMDRLEAAARDAGASRASVDTFSFQARPFYEKRGYTVFGTLEGCFGSEARYWLVKDL